MNNIIRNDFPYPIAKVYLETINAEEPIGKFTMIGYLFEISLKYAAAISIAQYLKSNQRDERINGILSGISRPSLGKWAEFLRETLKYNLNNNDSLLSGNYSKKSPDYKKMILAVNRMNEQLNPEKPQVVSTLSPEYFSNTFVSYRNKTKGHGAIQKADCQKINDILLDAVEEYILSFEEFVKYTPVYISKIEIGKDRNFYLTLQKLNSTDILKSSYSSPKIEESIVTGHICLTTKSENGLLPILSLHPIFIFIEDKKEIYVLNEGESSKIEYLCYHRGGKDAIYSPDELKEDFIEKFGDIIKIDSSKFKATPQSVEQTQIKDNFSDDDIPLVTEQETNQEDKNEKAVLGKECSNCKATIEDGSKFCKNCGTPIITEIVCNNCNTTNSPGSKFCKDCGTPLLVSGQETKKVNTGTLIKDSDGNADTKSKISEEDMKKAKMLRDKGEEQASGKNFDKAIELFTESLELNPHDPETWGSRGEAFYSISKYDSAIKDCSKALDVSKAIDQEDKENLSFFYCRGMAYYELENYSQALNDFNAAIKLDHYDFGFFMRGKTYYMLEDYGNALKDFKDAIKRDNSSAEYFWWRGRVYYELENYNNALNDFSEAIKLDNSIAYYSYWCGMSYYNLEKYNNALSAFKDAIKLDNSNAEYCYWRGMAYYNLKKYSQAISDFKDAIKLDNSVAYYFFMHGMAYYELGNYNAALQVFNMAIKRDNSVADYFNMRGNAYYSLGNIERAKQDYEKALRIDPDNETYTNNIKATKGIGGIIGGAINKFLS